MDLLAGFRTFIRIAETGSFSAVAREAGATQPAISRQLAALEEHLGVRLFQRSTRSLRLTDDGRDLLSHARHVLEVVEETEAAAGRRRGSPSGLVRIGSPGVFGSLYIAPRLGPLLDRYPELLVELTISDDVVDMVQAGLDLAIRAGTIADASLVARRIGVTQMVAVAAPAYLERYGIPERPADLAARPCILLTRLAHPESWNFNGPEGAVTIEVAGRMRTSSIDAVVACATAGIGIAVVPLWLVQDLFVAGRLVRILPTYQCSRIPISIVYPSRRFLAPRTRALIDYLVDEFRLEPSLSSYGEA